MILDLFRSNKSNKKHLGLITRCKDEYFVEEFVNYYLGQGVDEMYILDDDSEDKSIYRNLQSIEKINVIYAKNLTTTDYVDKFYRKIRNKFEWLIYVDVDEFITTRQNPEKTIREELNDTFSDVQCVKIPWVMMSCNGIVDSPSSVLKTNTYRWNHNLKHDNKNIKHRKFRCRYDEIEIKCIFKPKYFKSIWDHHPKHPISGVSIKIVESIKNQLTTLDPYYECLREENISSGYLLCYHYRIISLENCKAKLTTNAWYQEDGYTIDELMATDYAEIEDRTLANKVTSG